VDGEEWLRGGGETPLNYQFKEVTKGPGPATGSVNVTIVWSAAPLRDAASDTARPAVDNVASDTITTDTGSVSRAAGDDVAMWMIFTAYPNVDKLVMTQKFFLGCVYYSQHSVTCL
jgi:hypothetical protein